MRILMVSQGVPSKKYPMNGIHQFAYARALKDHGIDCLVASLDTRHVLRWRKPGLSRGTYQGVAYYNYNQYILTNQAQRAGQQALKGFERLYRQVKKEESFDLIHSHFYEPSYPVALLEGRDLPLVVSEHSSKVNKEERSQIPDDIFQVAQATYTRADALVVGSPFFQKRLAKVFHQEALVLPTVVNDKSFKIGYNKGKNKKIVATGNLKKEKGHRELIEAYQAYIRDRGACLHIFGEGPDRPYLQGLIQTYGLEDQVFLRGHRGLEDLAREYEQAAFFVLASHTETYGKAYVEAMAAGLPVLTVNNGGSEHFINQHNGLIAKKEDQDDLGRKMLYLLEHLDSYDASRIRGWQQAHFSEKKAVMDLKNLYQRLLRGENIGQG